MAALDDRISQVHPCYAAMFHHWETVAAVRDGQNASDEAPIKGSLFRNPIDTDDRYYQRKKQAVFSPWYSRLVAGVVGLMLRKPITFQASEAIATDLEDVDLLGDNLQAFSGDLFQAAIDDGWVWIRLEYPDSDAQNLAQARARGDRPYWSMIRAVEVLDWDYGLASENGKMRQGFRYLKHKALETVRTDDMMLQVVTRCYEYYLEDGSVRVAVSQYEEGDGDGDESHWVSLEERTLNYPFIPWVPVTTKSKLLTAQAPPMLAIAQLNIRHYQLNYQLDNLIYNVAHPVVVWRVLDEVSRNSDEELQAQSMAISAAMTKNDSGVLIPTSGGAEWLTCDPRAIAPLESQIMQCENQMGKLSLATMTSPKNVAESAESKQLDRTQSDSIMAAIAQNLEDALNLALYYHQYMRGESGEQPSCQVNRDFNPVAADAAIFNLFTTMQRERQLTLKTMLEQCKLHDLFIGDLDVEEELAAIDEEFGTMTVDMSSDFAPATTPADEATVPPEPTDGAPTPVPTAGGDAPLFGALGVGGTQALMNFVSGTTLPIEKSVEVLGQVFGISPDNARAMLPDVQPVAEVPVVTPPASEPPA